MPALCCGFSKCVRKALATWSTTEWPFSASVSLSVVLAHTQESNVRSGNEKSPSRVILLRGGLNNAVFQCTGKETEPFSEQFLNKGKKLSPLPEVPRSWRNRAPHFHGNTPQVQHLISEKLPHLCAYAVCRRAGQRLGGRGGLFLSDV